MTFDMKKFKTLVHYICWSCDPERLGKTKLNKILLYADTTSFERTGKSLTGETYVKHQFGPVPRNIDMTLEQLRRDGHLAIRAPEAQYEMTLFFASTRPALDQFTAEEISLVDHLMNDICNHHTASSISHKTHDAIYHLAEMGEEIPYCAFLAADLGEITDVDMQWAKEALAHAGSH